MPSYTSSSERSDKYGRPLPGRSLRAAAWLGLVVMIAAMSGWELYWRSEGSIPSYRNSDGLWAIQRRRIDNGEGDGTVIVGSSRAYFNFQLDTWRQAAGERPIQLSLEGTTPVPIMEDLADDEDFTGLLVVGVAPGPFFGGGRYRSGALEHYRRRSPSQWLGQRISMLVEPYLAFYAAQQRDIDFRVRNVHAATRDVVAGFSPGLAQLVALDFSHAIKPI